VLAEACERGASPSDLEFVLYRTTPDWKVVVKVASKGGHLHVCRWMREHRDDRGPWQADFYEAMSEAARYGHLYIIEWLHERALSSIDGGVLLAAASHGHLITLKWLYEHTTAKLEVGDAAAAICCAADSGHFATVQWVYENFQVTYTAFAMAGAARNGDLAMLEWLHQQKRCTEACSRDAMDAAARRGHLHIVEWLFENCSKICSNDASLWAAFRRESANAAVAE